MKKILKYFVVLVCLFGLSMPLEAQINQEAEAMELFDQANESYRNAAYIKALEEYQNLEDSGWTSAELYLNIGNTFYQLNELAPSIYYFEKALKVNPELKEASNNLDIANRNTIDDINALPLTVLQKWDEQYIKILSYESWAKVTIGMSFLFGICFLLFHFSISSTLRRVFFVTSILAAVGVLSGLGISFKEYNDAKRDRGAIVFVPQIEVVNAPTENAQVDFSLHEGTKVQVLDAVDVWKKIKIADGSTGWLKGSSIREY